MPSCPSIVYCLANPLRAVLVSRSSQVSSWSLFSSFLLFLSFFLFLLCLFFLLLSSFFFSSSLFLLSSCNLFLSCFSIFFSLLPFTQLSVFLRSVCTPIVLFETSGTDCIAPESFKQSISSLFLT